ncbi:MAG: diacylglycerol kinase family protein [Coriobacteriia bacterium]|nr:diacylglycerol kinase family protein [Coriobacteriia bacterium]
MRVLCVVNPWSGQDEFGFYDFVRVLGRNEAEVVLRFIGRRHSHVSHVQDAKQFDRVVAVGGDGTVSAICYALRDTGVPVMAFPAGTANLITLNLRMPTDPADLAETLLRGSIRSFDMGELTCRQNNGKPSRARPRHAESRRGFMVAAGAGFDAKIMEAADDFKPAIGAAAYLLGALQNLAPTVSKFTLTIDGEKHSTEGIAVLVVNFARLQFDLAITHNSDPCDGSLEVVVLRTRNAVQLLPAVWGAFLDRTTGSRPDRSPGLEIHSAHEVEVEAEPELALQHDGEVLPATTPFSARVLPQAATLVVPETYVSS